MLILHILSIPIIKRLVIMKLESRQCNCRMRPPLGAESAGLSSLPFVLPRALYPVSAMAVVVARQRLCLGRPWKCRAIQGISRDWTDNRIESHRFHADSSPASLKVNTSTATWLDSLAFAYSTQAYAVRRHSIVHTNQPTNPNSILSTFTPFGQRPVPNGILSRTAALGSGGGECRKSAVAAT